MEQENNTNQSGSTIFYRWQKKFNNLSSRFVARNRMDEKSPWLHHDCRVMPNGEIDFGGEESYPVSYFEQFHFEWLEALPSTPSQQIRSKEEILNKHILEYNKLVNDLSKFRLDERELKMFSAAMEEYHQQFKAETPTPALSEQEIERMADDSMNKLEVKGSSYNVWGQRTLMSSAVPFAQ